MNVLFCASEATPFAKSGGLGDVAGALPKALVKDGVDCRVVLPLYGDLKFRDELNYVTNFSVPVGWRSQYCGLFTAVRDGVTFYFLDNEYYFKRSGLYGFYDDGERFATKAVNDIKAGKIEYRLDKANIIHVPIGKASFSEEQLADNFQTLIDAVNKAKPATLKGQYMKSVSVAPTMGPGVKINPLKLV